MATETNGFSKPALALPLPRLCRRSFLALPLPRLGRRNLQLLSWGCRTSYLAFAKAGEAEAEGFSFSKGSFSKGAFSCTRLPLQSPRLVQLNKLYHPMVICTMGGTQLLIGPQILYQGNMGVHGLMPASQHQAWASGYALPHLFQGLPCCGCFSPPMPFPRSLGAMPFSRSLGAMVSIGSCAYIYSYSV